MPEGCWVCAPLSVLSWCSPRCVCPFRWILLRSTRARSCAVSSFRQCCARGSSQSGSGSSSGPGAASRDCSMTTESACNPLLVRSAPCINQPAGLACEIGGWRLRRRRCYRLKCLVAARASRSIWLHPRLPCAPPLRVCVAAGLALRRKQKNGARPAERRPGDKKKPTRLRCIWGGASQCRCREAHRRAHSVATRG